MGLLQELIPDLSVHAAGAKHFACFGEARVDGEELAMGTPQMVSYSKVLELLFVEPLQQYGLLLGSNDAVSLHAPACKDAIEHRSHAKHPGLPFPIVEHLPGSHREDWVTQEDVRTLGFPNLGHTGRPCESNGGRTDPGFLNIGVQDPGFH